MVDILKFPLSCKDSKFIILRSFLLSSIKNYIQDIEDSKTTSGK